MKYYLIAGEASGDLHAANLMLALKQEDANAQFRCWGGELMQQAGGELVKHYQELAFMGFWEVLQNLPAILKNIRFCKKDIFRFQPDVLILIDYSGFNLRIAKWAKTSGLKVFYYISPQVWASRQGRVASIKKWVDRLFVILPFERAFYQKFAINADYVGHPLLDAIAQFEPDADFTAKYKITKPIIALLPGSRKQEVQRILKIMLPLAKQFVDYQFVIAAPPSIPLIVYEKIIEQTGIEKAMIILVQNKTYDLLKRAQAALVTSGTATLEAALFEVPQIVCYKTNPLTYQIAKSLIKVPYISLVNLITGQPLVKELIQKDLTSENLKRELEGVLAAKKTNAIKTEYKALKKRLGNKGASKKAAKLMVKYLN